MSKVRIGVIGVGYLGRHHVRIYHSLPDVDLVGIADISEKDARPIASKYKTKYFKDYHNLLPLVDAVSIVVPTSLHYKVAIDCIDAGVHTMIEKPMVPTREEAKQLLEYFRDKGLLVQVGHVERYNTAIQEISSMIDRPVFIEVHRLAPFVNRALDVGVVLDLMIHDIDIVLSFVKSRVRKIDAIGSSILTSHEDIANVRMLFENGCVVNMTASRISAHVMRKIRVFQPTAYISVDYAKQKFVVYEKRDGIEVPRGLSDIKCRRPRASRKEPLYLELEDFVRSVCENTKPLVSGEEAFLALEIAHRILAAMKTPS